MPLTSEQLAALAASGALNRQIEAQLGHALTDAERLIIDKARLVSKLRRIKKRQDGPQTNSAALKKMRARDRTLVLRPVADQARRDRLEADPPAWLKWYAPRLFDVAWSAGHLDMIAGAIRAHETGTGIAVAAPRGEGKTSVLRGVGFYLVATGKVRFPLLAGWTHKSATEGFRFWLRMLHESEEFAADYPELTMPFEEGTHSTRIKNFTWEDGMPCGAEVRAVDRCIILPDSRGAIVAASVQGDVKGLSITLPNGESIRPNLLLLDDAQDPERAGNPDFVAAVIERIEKQWMCLGGRRSRITTMAACTVAHAGDVSEHLLARPDWESIRHARVLTWPTGWDEKDSETRKLWDEWNGVRIAGLQDHDGGAAGVQFYTENRAAMAGGMTVSWPENFDTERGDPDALYGAMVDLYRIGPEAFASEYQNAPLVQGVTLYNLTAEIITSRTMPDFPPLKLPTWTQIVVAATDVNYSYGLSTAVVAFGADQRAHVLAYEVYADAPLPVGKDEPPAVISRAVSESLVIVGRRLAAFAIPGLTWIIDGGGTPQDCVINFCAASQSACGLQGLTAFGRDAKGYRPFGRDKIIVREQCHLVSRSMAQRWLLWNAHYWLEAAQKGWTATPGMPGSLTLCAGKHEDFAAQICREQLKGKADMGAGMRWEWHTQPGPHDYGDCMAMAYMGAAWGGIGTGGQARAPARIVSRPRTGTPSRVSSVEWEE